VTRWHLGVGALGLVLVGILLGQGWAVRTHAANDHVQHHMVILVMNELIRRDPTLAAFVTAALGAPEAVTAPGPPADPRPVDAPDSP
jgi:hypothetical protein